MPVPLPNSSRCGNIECEIHAARPHVISTRKTLEQSKTQKYEKSVVSLPTASVNFMFTLTNFRCFSSANTQVCVISLQLVLVSCSLPRFPFFLGLIFKLVIGSPISDTFYLCLVPSEIKVGHVACRPWKGSFILPVFVLPVFHLFLCYS